MGFRVTLYQHGAERWQLQDAEISFSSMFHKPVMSQTGFLSSLLVCQHTPSSSVAANLRGCTRLFAQYLNAVAGPNSLLHATWIQATEWGRCMSERWLPALCPRLHLSDLYVCLQVVEVKGLAEPSPRFCRKPLALLPNWVSLSYLEAAEEKASAVHLLCQIGFLQFELASPEPDRR